LGKGLGAESLKIFLHEYVFSQFDACLVDPDRSNQAAIKAYARAGFSTMHEVGETIIMVAKKEKRKNPLIILGSSRSDGHTVRAIKTVIKENPVSIVDLRNLNISHYDYDYAHANDDFIPLAEQIVRHDPIILATPVYWYTMSALMKTFIDRWSDLLHFRKDIGYRLVDRDLYVIASYGDSMPRGFEDAFSQTCDYLNMRYKGCYYFYSGEHPELGRDNVSRAGEFWKTISGFRA